MAAQLTKIPSPPALPVLGHVLWLPKARFVQYLLELSRRFDGIFELNFGTVKVPFVCAADLVAELCDESRFRKAIRPPLLFLRDFVGDGLFTARADEPNWGKAHRVLMPAFGSRAMKGYFDRMLDVAQQLIRKWETRAGADILVADDMTRLALGTIGLAGFDYRFNGFAAEAPHPFVESMARTMSAAMIKSTRLPLLNRFMRPDKRYLADIARMNNLVDEVIRQRRECPVETDDLLNLMLNAVDPETNEKLDDVNIRYQILTFLIAGHETTSGVLTFALYQLLRCPHVLAQAYAEVDRVLPGDTTPTYPHLAQLDVIERVLKETLRLWPTAPGFMVTPYQTTVIGGRYLLRAGQSVSVPLPALHRDPKVWSDPDTFDIDRFLPDAEAKRHPHAYKPFGNGRRACIGRQFALTEMKLALGLILQRFAVSDPYNYRLVIKETMTIKPDAFYIHVKRREPHQRLRVAVAREEPLASARTNAADVRGAGTPFTVLYGTSLGTSREVAEHIAEQAGHSGFAATVTPLDAHAKHLPTDGVLIVVTATYNGKAPDSAQQAASAIERGAWRSLKRPGLKYAVLGCGNSQWPTYQAFPKLVHAALAEIGAAEIVSRAEADGNGDFDGAVERWLGELWKALGSNGAAAAVDSPSVALRYTSSRATDVRLLPVATHTFSVLGNEELVHDPAGLWDFRVEAPRSSTRHITLALPEGASYRTGDHLGIYPRNRPERVAAIARRLGVKLDAVVVLQGDAERVKHLPLGQPVTVAQLLRDFVELQDPLTRKDMRRLLPLTPCPHTRSQLEQLLASAQDDGAGSRFQKEITEKRVALYDLLDRFPAIELPLEVFIGFCPPMRPRLYSISSSSLASPRELSLTIGAVIGQAWSGKGDYRGVASAYLNDLPPEETLLGFVRTPASPFAPVSDPAQPMILIGPGTGFAPFRGFLRERAAQKAQGARVAPSLLFYGCRHPQHDWFYQDEMREAQARGIIELHVAFSAVPAHPHRFVQNAVWAERDAVWEMLAGGATVYVCGDGRFMAPAVRDALIRIYMEKRAATHDTASAWLQSLINSNRYRQDVFGDS